MDGRTSEAGCDWLIAPWKKQERWGEQVLKTRYVTMMNLIGGPEHWNRFLNASFIKKEIDIRNIRKNC